MFSATDQSRKWIIPCFSVLVGTALLILDQTVLYILEAKSSIVLWEWVMKVVEIGICLFVMRWLLRRNAASTAERKELMMSPEQLEESEKLTMIGVLAAGIAHEIRNPLTSLRGFVQLLRMKQPEYTGIMLSEIDRINQIVSELLILAKPKELKLELIDICRLVQQTTTFLQPHAALSNVVIHVDVDTRAADARIHGDENKLKQVLINIVKNAVEAMPDGGDVTVAVRVQNQQVLFEITDTGKGMSREQLEQLTRAFYSTKPEGTGLGLMVSDRIIREHGGSVQFESKPDLGTTVRILLPLFRPD